MLIASQALAFSEIELPRKTSVESPASVLTKEWPPYCGICYLSVFLATQGERRVIGVPIEAAKGLEHAVGFRCGKGEVHLRRVLSVV